MIEAKKKHPGFEALIVNISSIRATVASVNRAEYCISEAGLSMLTKLFACRLGEFNIPVYKLQPGITKTDTTEMVIEKNDKMLEERLCSTARLGFPRDVGKIVASLSRSHFLYSTGQVFIVDGGLVFHDCRVLLRPEVSSIFKNPFQNDNFVAECLSFNQQSMRGGGSLTTRL